MAMHFHRESSSLAGAKGVRVNSQEKQEKCLDSDSGCQDGENEEWYAWRATRDFASL